MRFRYFFLIVLVNHDGVDDWVDIRKEMFDTVFKTQSGMVKANLYIPAVEATTLRHQ